jgi:hypothetical protein
MIQSLAHQCKQLLTIKRDKRLNPVKEAQLSAFKHSWQNTQRCSFYDDGSSRSAYKP